MNPSTLTRGTPGAQGGHVLEPEAASPSRSAAQELEDDLAPLALYYSSAWRRPLLRSPAGPDVCPEDCPYCSRKGAA